MGVGTGLLITFLLLLLFFAIRTGKKRRSHWNSDSYDSSSTSWSPPSESVSSSVDCSSGDNDSGSDSGCSCGD